MNVTDMQGVPLSFPRQHATGKRTGVNWPWGLGQVCPCCRLDICKTCSVPVSQAEEGIKYKHAGRPLHSEWNQIKMLASFVLSGIRKLSSGSAIQFYVTQHKLQHIYFLCQKREGSLCVLRITLL